ncbi:RNA pseudouridylate synthase family protein [Babesia divergens]|uniref:RNA pseudouridylate synthase family protein n=1 Tax=Babesia divergens TaxID=32595 RepID=A0AAD9LJ65_BABDI|nr:RNA pseudouridylate synthase family protein [Babesia divergens]
MKRKARASVGSTITPTKRFQASDDPGTLEEQSSQIAAHEVTYYFKDGFRLVLPYDHVYESFTKQRWFGRTLYDVMSSEFAAFTDEYVKSACANGLMKVFDVRGNDLYPEPGEQILDHICSPNEKLWHLAVVHEQLALDKRVRILHEDDDYIAVSKPSSIPVYHTGTYYFNSLVEILKREVFGNAPRQLYPVHRLDKLTSGVIILAKNSKAASQFGAGLTNSQFRKVYLARVRGNFSRVFDEHKCITLDDGSGLVACCHGYMRVVSHKFSVHEFTRDYSEKNAKPSETRFRMVAYNPDLDESLILCYPVTGRTHQIRAHVKFLGFPISNDRCYNDGELSASTHYYPDLPVVHWELDDQGRWRMPELGFVAPKQDKPILGNKKYHIGLNKPAEGLRPSPSGIFLHALRYIWLGRLNISDCAPEWVQDFGIQPNEGFLSKLDLWDDTVDGKIVTQDATGNNEDHMAPVELGDTERATELATQHP